MKKELYIFGSGGFAKDVYFLSKDTGEYIVTAFVDIIDDEEKVDYIELEERLPIISENDFSSICQNRQVYAAIAIADNKIVRHIVAKFQDRCIFPNIIAPQVKIFSPIKMGKGNLITYGNFVSFNVEMGSFNRVNISCIIGHDCKIGDFNQINPNCPISGHVVIGDNNFIGVSSTIIQGISIGDNNVIGAGSVVIQNVNDNGLYMGNPARLMGRNLKK